MKVKELLNSGDVKYCTAGTTAHNAAKIMKTANCGALPVIDNKKKVIGLVTDRDICLSLATKKSKPASKVNVKDIMTSSVHTVHADDDVSKALREMRINKIGRVPVIDNAGLLKGIVSLHDMISEATSNGKLKIGTLSAKGENLMKTMNAITSRYSSGNEWEAPLKM